MLGLEILENAGLNFLARWAHVISGITWIGLLYYFNFVQVPAFARFDVGTRNEAVDKLASRALWWFRWAALATFAFGVMLGFVPQSSGGTSLFEQNGFFEGGEGIAINMGMWFGIVMFANVWLVIWRNQKTVIASARNVAAGGEADPNAVDAGRRALLASRQNVIFSFPMLFLMIGATHFFNMVSLDISKDHTSFWVVFYVVLAIFELNCLGIIGGRGQNVTNWMYENHKRAIGVGLVLIVFWYAAFDVML